MAQRGEWLAAGPAARSFVEEVEAFAGRTFRYRIELAFLKDASDRSDRAREEFERVAFLAKFVTHARAILSRSGPGVDDTAKLNAEFADAVQEISRRFRSLFASAPDDVRARFLASFLDVNERSLEELLSLLAELSWFQNYSIDRKQAG